MKIHIHGLKLLAFWFVLLKIRKIIARTDHSTTECSSNSADVVTKTGRLVEAINWATDHYTIIGSTG